MLLEKEIQVRLGLALAKDMNNSAVRSYKKSSTILAKIETLGLVRLDLRVIASYFGYFG